jgi:c-di-GMP-binding flagellar brake protein YcgR
MKNSKNNAKKKSSPAVTGINRRKEFRLELPLAAKVEGTLPDGEKFAEETTIVNISSKGAYLGLDSLITVGTNLKIKMQLPSNLTEGKKLHLSLKGQVVRLEKSETPGKIQGVALNFDEEFEGEDIQFISETS